MYTFHVLVTCKWYGGFGMKNLGLVEWKFNKYLIKYELIDSYEIEQFVRFDGSTINSRGLIAIEPLNGSFHHIKLKWKDHRLMVKLIGSNDLIRFSKHWLKVLYKNLSYLDECINNKIKAKKNK